MPDVLFHYTSLETAILIIESQTLHLSNIRFCNDGAEFLYGESRLQKLSNRERSDRPTTYRVPYWIACFSACADSFSQWMLYADQGRGVCLGFDLSSMTNSNCKLVNVEYDVKKQDALLLEHISSFENGKNITHAFEDFCRFKDPGFGSEQETRLMMFSEWKDLFPDFVRYCARSGRLIPRYECKFDRSALKSVTFGPNAKHPLNRASMELLLQRARMNCHIGYSAIEA